MAAEAIEGEGWQFCQAQEAGRNVLYRIEASLLSCWSIYRLRSMVIVFPSFLQAMS